MSLTINLEKVCRLPPHSKGVVFGYQVLSPPITDKDRTVLATFQEVSQDLTGIKTNPFDRLDVPAKIRIMRHFLPEDIANQYENYLIEHGFKLRTFLHEGFKEDQEGSQFIVFSDFTGVLLLMYLEGKRQIDQAMDNTGWVSVQLPETLYEDAELLESFLTFIRETYIVSETLPNGKFRFKSIQIQEQQNTFIESLFKNQGFKFERCT